MSRLEDLIVTVSHNLQVAVPVNSLQQTKVVDALNLQQQERQKTLTSTADLKKKVMVLEKKRCLRFDAHKEFRI